MSECKHLRATVKRQLTPGSLALMLLAAITFAPRLIDTIKDEPWIANELIVARNSDGIPLVEDRITTNAPVFGQRATFAVSEQGTVICGTGHTNAWRGESKQFWRLSAFIGCPQPSEPYRVCSAFSLTSGSGRHRTFDPVCSPLTQPVAQRDQ